LGASALRARRFVIVNISAFSKWLALGAALVAASAACAADPIVLTLKDHQFTPAAVTVPAGERFRIEDENRDTTPAEFESSDLRVEKIVVPGGRIVVNAGPLKPGTYTFFDDYHPDQAKGTLTAVAGKARD
jgi:plastocyanin